MKISSRKKLIALLVLGALSYLVYRFVHAAPFNWAKIVQSVRESNPYYLGLSLFAIYGCYALRALRWKVFQKNLGQSRFSAIYEVTLAGFSALLLMGRLGEPVRPILMARKEKLPVAPMFGIYALERLFDFASMAIIAAVGLVFFLPVSRSSDNARAATTAAKSGGILLFLVVAVAIGVLVFLRVHGTSRLERRLQGWNAAHAWRARVARIVLGFLHGVQSVRTLGELALAVIYSTAHWFLVLLVYFWVAESFRGALGPMTLGDATLVLAFSLVGSVIQLPGVGGGSQAGSIIAYTAIFGVEREPAVAVSIVLWLITFAACSLVGVPLLIREGWSLGELRRMAEHEREVLEEEAVAGAKSASGQGDSAQ